MIIAQQGNLTLAVGQMQFFSGLDLETPAVDYSCHINNNKNNNSIYLSGYVQSVHWFKYEHQKYLLIKAELVAEMFFQVE